jgi:ankyrin repeat protein
MRCLVNDLGADVNRGRDDGFTPLMIAAQMGKMAAVKCFVKELGADINKPSPLGATPLMVAARHTRSKIVTWLVKEGANVHQSLDVTMRGSTAADISKKYGASAEQTAYLEAKQHCSSPGCDGAGVKKCPACKQGRYCGEPCQYEHWKAHKADCGGGAPSSRRARENEARRTFY